MDVSWLACCIWVARKEPQQGKKQSGRCDLGKVRVCVSGKLDHAVPLDDGQDETRKVRRVVCAKESDRKVR